MKCMQLLASYSVFSACCLGTAYGDDEPASSTDEVENHVRKGFQTDPLMTSDEIRSLPTDEFGRPLSSCQFPADYDDQPEEETSSAPTLKAQLHLNR